MSNKLSDSEYERWILYYCHNKLEFNIMDDDEKQIYISEYRNKWTKKIVEKGKYGNHVNYQNLFYRQSEFLDRIVSEHERAQSGSRTSLEEKATECIVNYAHDLLFSSDVDICDLSTNLSDLLKDDEETVLDAISQEMDYFIEVTNNEHNYDHDLSSDNDDESPSVATISSELDGSTNDSIHSGSSDIYMTGNDMMEGRDSFNSRCSDLKSMVLPPECRNFMNFTMDKDGFENHEYYPVYWNIVMKKVNSIINRSFDDDYEDMVGIARILVHTKMSHNLRNELIGHFHNIKPTFCASYDELVRFIVKNSCFTACVRRFVRCGRCLELHDSLLLFCPKCAKEDVLYPLYQRCPVNRCQCNIDIRSAERTTDPEKRQELKKLWCCHVRRNPSFESCFYFPEIGAIGDWIHSGLWNTARCLTSKELGELCSYCDAMGFHHLMVGENMKTICRVTNYTSSYQKIESITHQCDNRLSSLSVLDEMFVIDDKDSIQTKKDLIWKQLRRDWIRPIQTINHVQSFFDSCQDYLFFSVLSQMASLQKTYEDVRTTCISNCQVCYRHLKSVCPNLIINNKDVIDKIYKGMIATLVYRVCGFLLESEVDVNPSKPLFSCDSELLELAESIQYQTIGSTNNDYASLGLSGNHKSPEYAYYLKYVTDRIIARERRGLTTIVPPLWEKEVIRIMEFIDGRAKMDFCQSIIQDDSNSINGIVVSILPIIEDLYSHYLVSVDVPTFPDSSPVDRLSQYLKALIERILSKPGLEEQAAVLIDCNNQLATRLSGESPSVERSIDKKKLLEPWSMQSNESHSKQAYMDNKVVKEYLACQVKGIKETDVKYIIPQLYVSTMAVDDVSVFSYSKKSNSVAAVTQYCSHFPQSMKHLGIDMFFNLTLPVTPKTSTKSCLNKDLCRGADYSTREGRLSLKRSHSMSSYNSLLHCRGSIRTTLDGKEACNNTVFSTDGTYDTIILPQYQPTITKKRQTCSQSFLRESLNLMLKDVYRTGLAGIPYIVGDHVLYVKTAIIGVRGDNPAMDCFFDSSGKQSSNYPCTQCNCSRSYWDRNTNTLMNELDWFMGKDKAVVKLFVSALSLLQLDDPLRLISLVKLMQYKNDKEIVDYLNNLASKSEITSDYIKRVVRSLKRCVLSNTTPLWIPPQSQYCGVGVNEKYYPTNYDDTIGKVDGEEYLINGLRNSRAIDYMHIINNLFDFLWKKDDTNEEFYERLSQELKHDIITTVPIGKQFIPQVDIDRAKDLLSKNSARLPNNWYDVFLNCVDSSGDGFSIRSHDKMVFLMCCFRWLFRESNSQLVKCLSKICYYLYAMYNYRRSVTGFIALQKKYAYWLYVLENIVAFKGITLSLHLPLHSLDVYRRLGPLKQLDCMYCEWCYKQLKKAVGSPNPFTTLFQNQRERFTTSVYSYNAPSIFTTMNNDHILSDSLFKSMIDEISDIQWKCRVLSAFKAEEQYRYCDYVDIPSIVDIELLCGVFHFLKHGFTHLPKRYPHQSTLSNLFCSNDSDIQELIKELDYSNDLLDVSGKDGTLFYKCCKYNNCMCESVSCLLDTLCPRHILSNPKAFSVVFDITGRIHLFASCGYFKATVKNKEIILAVGYFVPIIPLEEDTDCVFDIDMSRLLCSSPIHIVNVARLCFDLAFVQNDINDAVTGLLLKIYSPEFNINAMPYS